MFTAVLVKNFGDARIDGIIFVAGIEHFHHMIQHQLCDEFTFGCLIEVLFELRMERSDCGDAMFFRVAYSHLRNAERGMDMNEIESGAL